MNYAINIWKYKIYKIYGGIMPYMGMEFEGLC